MLRFGNQLEKRGIMLKCKYCGSTLLQELSLRYSKYNDIIHTNTCPLNKKKSGIKDEKINQNNLYKETLDVLERKIEEDSTTNNNQN